MYDVAIVGGGIIGLATAFEYLQKNPFKRLVLIEKESKVAFHQTGNNTGVIHSGIYYKLNSLKAKNCRRGVKKLLHFCDKYGVEYKLCGKIIIATKENEIPHLDNLFVKELKKLIPEIISKDIVPGDSGVRAQALTKDGKLLDDFKIIRNKNIVHVLNDPSPAATSAFSIAENIISVFEA